MLQGLVKNAIMLAVADCLAGSAAGVVAGSSVAAGAAATAGSVVSGAAWAVALPASHPPETGPAGSIALGVVGCVGATAAAWASAADG